MRRTDFALLRHEQIAREVSNPAFKAEDWVLFIVAALALIVIGVTS